MSGPAVGDAGAWLDEDRPHDAEIDRAQIAGLRRLLAPSPRSVLDLGCGGGRALVPLAGDGHRVTGLDAAAAALDRCRRRLERAGAAATLIEADFLAAAAWPPGSFDAVLCLGNTFMTVADVDDAVTLLRRAGAVLARDGVVVIDDLPRDFWPELTEGRWQSGVSERGDLQLVWRESDAVFALRHAHEIDPRRSVPDERDRPLRLWTDGALRLACRAAGLSGPHRVEFSHLLVMRRAEPG